MELKSIQIQTVHNLRKGIDQNSSSLHIAAGIPFNKKARTVNKCGTDKGKAKKSYLIIQFQSYFQLEAKFHL
jgi:hypothetical protein